MPFFEIPSAAMQHLSLFGYDAIADDGAFAWYSGPRGRTKVEKAHPIVWLDDVNDAAQLGATGILLMVTAQ